MKKKTIIFINKYFLNILMGIIFILFVGLWIQRDKFNPDNDICEEENIISTCQQKEQLTESLRNYCKNGILFKDDEHGWCCRECNKFRPKNECEKGNKDYIWDNSTELDMKSKECKRYNKKEEVTLWGDTMEWEIIECPYKKFCRQIGKKIL